MAYKSYLLYRLRLLQMQAASASFDLLCIVEGWEHGDLEAAAMRYVKFQQQYEQELVRARKLIPACQAIVEGATS